MLIRRFGNGSLRSLLVRIQLSFDKAPDVGLVRLRKSCHTAGGLAGAVTNLGTAAKATIIAGALILSVQPLRAVGDTAGPLAADCPLASAGHLVAEVASSLDVVVDAHGNGIEGEDLIVMGVEEQVPHAGTPVAPGCHALEGIVEGNSNVGVLQIAPAIHVELSDRIHVEVRAERLVEKLDRRNSWMRCVVVTNLVENFDRVVDRVSLCPADVAVLARIIEPVLRLRSYSLSVQPFCDAEVGSNLPP